METATTRAVTYGRNSSAKQKSITDQLDENRADAAANGWTVVEELSDPSSASRYATKVRKNWATLLELLPTVDVVILWEPSRGDRDLEAWAGFLNSCRKHRVRIHAVTHQRTYDPRNARDYRSLAEDGVDSAYESDKISARVLRGQASAASSGRPHAPTTYGYLRHYDPVSRAFTEQVPHPDHAAVVRDIITSIAAGEPLHKVVCRLNDSGVPTPRGGDRWYHSVVRDIAKNQAYRPHPQDPAHGVRVHRGELHVAQWPPLVTESMWQAVQTVLGTNSEAARSARRNSAPGQIKYLLSGNTAVMTAACGAMLQGFVAPNGQGKNYGCKADRCSNAPMPEVDAVVRDLVLARLSRRDARKLWVTDDPKRRAAAEELARLRVELKDARESFARPGGISATALAMKETALADPIADAQRRARPSGEPLAVLEQIDPEQFADERALPAWESLPLLAKRALIVKVFGGRLVLGPATERLTRWTSPEDRYAVVADRITVKKA